MLEIKFQPQAHALAVFAIILSIFLYPSHSLSQRLGIAAIVNDDIISLYDLEERIDLLIITSNQKNTVQLRKRLSRQTLNRLIDEKLKLQDAKKLGIKVQENQLEQAFSAVEKQNKMPSGGLTQFLKSKGVNRLALLDQIEASLVWQETVRKKFRNRISISEEEIDDVINDIRESEGKPEYLTSEIFMPVNDPNRADEVLGNANRLIEQIANGANFSTLARNYSQSASAAVGGDLGWVRQGQLAKNLDLALSKLRKGGVSNAIRNVGGYNIIQKRDQRNGLGLPPSQEKINLRQVFLPLLTTDVNSLMAEANSMAARATDCSEMEKLEVESKSSLSGSLGIIETSTLPPAIQASVQNLPVGTPSDPTTAEGGVIFLMVCERTGSSALDIIRRKIKRNLTNKRLDISAKGYLRDLRLSAFLDVRI
jgi:peptidyl-prolyl cis-trans isomerase SurA